MFSRPETGVQHVLVNGAAGVLSWQDGALFAILAFTVTGGRIAEIEVLADPERLPRLAPGTGPAPGQGPSAGGRPV